MKQHLFRTLRWFFLSMLIVAIGPYILGKIGFYATSHADIALTLPQTNETRPPFSYADAVAKVAPSVVSIKTTREVTVEMNPLLQDPFFRRFFGGGENMPEPEPQEQQGLGSGVVVSEQGHVLTNNHVVNRVDTVTVTLQDGRSAEAKIIGTDPDTDLAVLQVDLKHLPVVPIGSTKDLRPGDLVLAIGNPYGFDQTVTAGIVSATERAGSEIGNLSNLIQTDAAINPGNSGGALIDLNGNLVGINTAIFSRSGGFQGIGFAIPIDQAKDIMQQLITGKKISRGWLGVVLQRLSNELRDQMGYQDETGVFVRATTHGSPAQKAGLRPGDVIRKINDTAVKEVSKATNLVAGLKPGDHYAIEIFRRGDIMTFTVQLGERPSLKDFKEKNKKG